MAIRIGYFGRRPPEVRTAKVPASGQLVLTVLNSDIYDWALRRISIVVPGETQGNGNCQVYVGDDDSSQFFVSESYNPLGDYWAPDTADELVVARQQTITAVFNVTAGLTAWFIVAADRIRYQEAGGTLAVDPTIAHFGE